MKHLFKTAVLTAMIAVCAVSLPATAQTSRQNTKKQMAKAVINGSKGNVATVTTSNKPKTKSASEAKGKSPSKAKETPKAKTTTTAAAKATTKAKATTTTAARATTTTTAKPKAKEAVKTTTTTHEKVVITDNGIGPVVLGTDVAKLPASYKGVYAKKEKLEDWDCGDILGYFWMFYDEKGKENFRVDVDDNNKIISITVYTPNMPMQNGMHVGMTQKQVEAYKGVKKIPPSKWADFPRLIYEYGKYELLMDWEDGKTVQEIYFSE